MMETPELSSKRLLLTPYLSSLVHQRHVDWLRDPEVVKYSEQRHFYHCLETQEAYVSQRTFEDRYLWLIQVPPGMLATRDIGTIRVSVDRMNRVGDMGILIGEKSMWGQGYGTEAWKTVMDYCFKGLELRKVECGTMLANIGMRRTATKCGMEPEGARLSHFILDGETQDLLLYGKKAK
jgi:ribosomal-protein-alanine N-acetyltransferase